MHVYIYLFCFVYMFCYGSLIFVSVPDLDAVCEPIWNSICGPI